MTKAVIRGYARVGNGETAVRRRREPRTRGFTLIELLVAIALLAVVSALAFRGLDQVVAAEQRLRQEHQHWRALNLVMATISDDLALAMARSVRIGTLRDAAFAGRQGVDKDARYDTQVRFTRRPPLVTAYSTGERSQRVGYRFWEGRLEKFEWGQLDVPELVEPTVIPLLDGLADVGWRFMDSGGRFYQTWPPEKAVDSIPRAVEVTLVLADGRALRRLVVLASFWSL